MTRDPLLDRRTVLRAAGTALALPFLTSLLPRGLWAAADGGSAIAAGARNRLVCVYFPHGVCNEQWYPAAVGKGYALSPSLAPLEKIKDRFTLISGLRHAANPEGGGHEGADTWLTGQRYTDPGISMDQVAASVLSATTRFPSLQLGNVAGTGAKTRSQTISFNASGSPLPTIANPAQLFARLFTADTPQSKATAAARLRTGGSIIDAVGDQAKNLSSQLSGFDKQRMDAFVQSVRDVEAQIQRDKAWLDAPKAPTPDASKLDLTTTSKTNRSAWLSTMYELIALALESDSTRVISFCTNGEGATSNGWPELGMEGIDHGPQHHGGNPGSLAMLAKRDVRGNELLAKFIERLSAAKDPAGGGMLDRTVLVYGSGMNNGSGFKNGTGVHGTSCLPMIVAGGGALGLKHGAHHKWDNNNGPALASVFVSVLNALGVPQSSFADAKGPLKELTA